MTPFSVHLAGSMLTLNLYDADGREITDMLLAADRAECQFGADWVEIFNGSEGMDRDEYTQLGGSECL